MLSFEQIPELHQCCQGLLETTDPVLRGARKALLEEFGVSLRRDCFLDVQECWYGLLDTGDQARDGEVGADGPRRVHTFQA